MRSRRIHANITVIIPTVISYVAALGSAGHFVYTYGQTEVQYPQLEPKTHAQSGTLHDPTGRQMELDTLIRKGTLTFSISATLSMRMRETEVNFLVENLPDNGSRFIVTINWENMGEKIYKSGYLDLKQYIEGVLLNVGLSAGEYPCIANSGAYRISDNACIGRVSARITLHTQN